MLDQVYAAVAATSVALGGLMVSNLLYDHGVEAGVSRSIAAFLGGLAFLMAVLWMSVWPAVGLSAAMTILMLGLHLRHRNGLRLSIRNRIARRPDYVRNQ